jgi:hypothetical protein
MHGRLFISFVATKLRRSADHACTGHVTPTAGGELHTETPDLYKALIGQCLAGVQTPLILIDWSDLTPDRRWQVLRASVALEGRSVTLYEQVHPLSRATAPRVHEAFLTRIKAMLPSGCVPLVITDAGFRSRGFALVNRMGWQWIGRIRNRDRVRPMGGDEWRGGKTLYARATGTAQALGDYDYVRSHPIPCRLVLIKRRRLGRHKRSVHGKRVRAHHSLKQARRARAVAVGGEPGAGALDRPGRGRHIRPTHADRGSLPGPEKRALRLGVVGRPQ